MHSLVSFSDGPKLCRAIKLNLLHGSCVFAGKLAIAWCSMLRYSSLAGWCAHSAAVCASPQEAVTSFSHPSCHQTHAARPYDYEPPAS